MEALKKPDQFPVNQPRNDIETIDLDSDEDIVEVKQDEDSSIVLSDLNVNVTEMELRRSIDDQRLNIVEPYKISLTKLSGKCDAKLHFNNPYSAQLFSQQFNNKSLVTTEPIATSPSPGVSPPRHVDGMDLIQLIHNETQKHEPKMVNTVPIFVDIISKDGLSIEKIKVHLYLHGKCQQFFGQEPKIIISAFLNYMKKYFPTTEGFQFVFITPCAASYIIFYSVLKENVANKQVFDSYFCSWTDLQSIVRAVQQSGPILQGCSYQADKEN